MREIEYHRGGVVVNCWWVTHKTAHNTNKGEDWGGSLAFNPTGNLLVAGGFRSADIVFGFDTLFNAGGISSPSDFFIAKLDTVLVIGMTDQTNSSTSITLFPNPSSGHITITSSATIDEIIITNLLGRVIYHTKPNQNNVELNVDRAGVYFVSLTSNIQTVTRKLVMQRWEGV